jgi:hypothetical protein
LMEVGRVVEVSGRSLRQSMSPGVT